MPSGRKPKPPGTAKRPEQQRYQWQHANDEGWAHGDTPPPPEGLLPRTEETWRSWFSSWFAAFWTPADVPQLCQVAELVDLVNRGQVDLVKAQPVLDKWGLTPKGRQDLRWAPPVGEVESATDDLADELNKRREARRARLKVDAI